MLSRLVADVGGTIAEILASPDRELPPEIEAGIQAFAGKTLNASTIKKIFFSSALSQIKDLDLAWYAEALLVGSTKVNDVSIDKIEELDATGISPTSLIQLMWFAIEVNFLPTFAAPVTSDGNDEAATESPIIGTSSWRGDPRRAGQRGQTSEETADSQYHI